MMIINEVFIVFNYVGVTARNVERSITRNVGGIPEDRSEPWIVEFNLSCLRPNFGHKTMNLESTLREKNIN